MLCEMRAGRECILHEVMWRRFKVTWGRVGGGNEGNRILRHSPVDKASVGGCGSGPRYRGASSVTLSLTPFAE